MLAVKDPAGLEQPWTFPFTSTLVGINNLSLKMNCRASKIATNLTLKVIIFAQGPSTVGDRPLLGGRMSRGYSAETTVP